MALQINKAAEHGFTASSAYVKISKFIGDKENVTFMIDYFYDEQARIDGKPPFGSGSYKMVTPTTDLLPALYTYLKTLDEFSGATDV